MLEEGPAADAAVDAEFVDHSEVGSVGLAGLAGPAGLVVDRGADPGIGRHHHVRHGSFHGGSGSGCLAHHPDLVVDPVLERAASWRRDEE